MVGLIQCQQPWKVFGMRINAYRSYKNKELLFLIVFVRLYLWKFLRFLILSSSKPFYVNYQNINSNFQNNKSQWKHRAIETAGGSSNSRKGKNHCHKCQRRRKSNGIIMTDVNPRSPIPCLPCEWFSIKLHEYLKMSQILRKLWYPLKHWWTFNALSVISTNFAWRWAMHQRPAVYNFGHFLPSSVHNKEFLHFF